MLRWLIVALVIVAGALGWQRVVGLASGRPQAAPATVRPVADLRPQEPWDGALDVPHIRQETNLCVPTSAAMVLAFYGDPQLPRRLKALAADRPYVAAAFSDFTITRFKDLIRGLKTLGYDWQEVTYPVTHEGFLRGLSRMEIETRGGHPVLVDISLNARESHTFVVAGVDRQNRMILGVDPNTPAPGRHRMTFDALEASWNESANGLDFRGMVVTSPKPTT
ncbi:MAG TPA: C39 family peptidase [Caulobacteraceae bacterium]|jgi:hypothetical protein|nr:C39 family peptidase [Caulobacteraceae bacterium]